MQAVDLQEVTGLCLGPDLMYEDCQLQPDPCAAHQPGQWQILCACIPQHSPKTVDTGTSALSAREDQTARRV